MAFDATHGHAVIGQYIMSKDDKETLDRRGFFRLGLQKTAQLAINEAEARVNKRARGWIRPPFSVGEFDFLLKCTRCDACIEACPHNVLFPLSKKQGLDVISTPAMDLMNKGCHLCADWPCVHACETGALVPFRASAPHSDEKLEQDDEADLPRPKLALASIDEQKCLPYMGPECGACADSCPQPDTLIWNGPKPFINADHCVGCALCREVCVAAPKAISIHPL